MMIERQIRARLLDLLQQTAAVALLGARQVGKTTLARSIAETMDSVYLDLEDPGDAPKLADDADFYLKQHRDKLIIIDEIQRKPDLFQTLRSRIDKNRRAGRRHGQFLLLGSASRNLLNQSSESLAGRISYQELHSFNLLEVGRENINDLWLRGGFPNAFLDADFSFQWRHDFIRTYLERDVPALEVRVPAETLRRFWTMLAHNQGQIFNASQISRNLDISGQTAGRYLDLMADLMLVRQLRPWRANVGKRLIKSPKTYIRDSGLLHALLGIRSLDGLLGHPVVGGSWEGFVIENILSVMPPHANAYFYRTSAGAEIDLVLSFTDELWVIEIKRTTAPKLTRGFRSACEDLKPAVKWIVYAGDEEYQLKEAVTVAPLSKITAEIAQRGN